MPFSFTSLANISPYMFERGAVHSAIRSLKELLKSLPGLPVPELRIDNVFDDNLQTAIAFVQKHKSY